jgi:hypothetical protein
MAWQKSCSFSLSWDDENKKIESPCPRCIAKLPMTLFACQIISFWQGVAVDPGSSGNLLWVLFRPITRLNVRQGIFHGVIGATQVPAKSPPQGADHHQDGSNGKNKDENQDPHQHR